ncbi:hypothetical protein niasHT_022449 [Heterodera trifolii]|uniref:Uncharacterized protein n=1 Tax=Heterodera trifolii TaxID=157864 RepID=A0ABD2K8R7_9BILA
MFWRLNCLAAILFALCCTSSTFWLGSATTDEQNKALHVDHHKLTETQQYESGKETDPKHDHEQFPWQGRGQTVQELTPEKSKERLKISAKNGPKLGRSSEGVGLRENINFMQKRYVNELGKKRHLLSTNALFKQTDQKRALENRRNFSQMQGKGKMIL